MGLIPDKVRHAGVWVINSTEAREHSHYSNTDDANSTDALLNR